MVDKGSPAQKSTTTKLSQKADIEVGDSTLKIFEWSDSSDEDNGNEDSKLLKEYRARNNGD